MALLHHIFRSIVLAIVIVSANAATTFPPSEVAHNFCFHDNTASGQCLQRILSSAEPLQRVCENNFRCGAVTNQSAGSAEIRAMERALTRYACVTFLKWDVPSHYDYDEHVHYYSQYFGLYSAHYDCKHDDDSNCVGKTREDAYFHHIYNAILNAHTIINDGTFAECAVREETGSVDEKLVTTLCVCQQQQAVDSRDRQVAAASRSSAAAWKGSSSTIAFAVVAMFIVR